MVTHLKDKNFICHLMRTQRLLSLQCFVLQLFSKSLPEKNKEAIPLNGRDKLTSFWPELDGI